MEKDPKKEYEKVKFNIIKRLAFTLYSYAFEWIVNSQLIFIHFPKQPKQENPLRNLRCLANSSAFNPFQAVKPPRQPNSEDCPSSSALIFTEPRWSSQVEHGGKTLFHGFIDQNPSGCAKKKTPKWAPAAGAWTSSNIRPSWPGAHWNPTENADKCATKQLMSWRNSTKSNCLGTVQNHFHFSRVFPRKDYPVSVAWKVGDRIVIAAIVSC